MAQVRNAICKYYISEGDCEKGFEGTARKACQTCKFYTANQQQQPKKKKRQNVDPDEVWRRKKERNKEARLKQQMIEDLENEDG